MQQAMESLLERLPGEARQQEMATQIASVAMRMGGFGIRSASHLGQTCCKIDSLRFETKSQTFLMGHSLTA